MAMKEKIKHSLKKGLLEDLQRGQVDCGMSRIIGGLFIRAMEKKDQREKEKCCLNYDLSCDCWFCKSKKK